MNITIFSDGASRGNPGPGGWGAIVIKHGESKDAGEVAEIGGREAHTTNNRMELSAAIGGLKEIRSGEEAVLNTDSSYVINGITKWVNGWKRNGWKTQTKDDVLNKDLWMELDALARDRKISWRYVGGHVGIAGNERCDEIATSMADGQDPKLYVGPLSSYTVSNVLDISSDPSRAGSKDNFKSRSRSQAYSYVSMVGGKIMTDKTWAECEKRVKGVKGARFKKTLNAEDERSIIAEFGQGKKL